MRPPRNTIWIDLENTPHVPFFAPIIRELERRGFRTFLTARDAYQTCEMADLYRFKYRRIGRHFGRNKALKAIGLGVRSIQLLSIALRERPALAVSHGSRSQVVASNLARIPSVMMDDYEHSHGVGLGGPRWLLLPRALANTGIARNHGERIRYYSGIKEDAYVPDFTPDPAIVDRLGLKDRIVVTVRPPATEAHYHNPASDELFRAFMERALGVPQTRVVLLFRNGRQRQEIMQAHPGWFQSPQLVVPDQVVDGLNLLWHSDLAVSGGGTMNREAAALGVPVYSIFRGQIGAIDEELRREGRLVLIENLADLQGKIAIARRPKPANPQAQLAPRNALVEIVTHIAEIAEIEQRGPS